MPQYCVLSFYKMQNKWYELSIDNKQSIFNNFSQYLTMPSDCKFYLYSTSYFRDDTDFLMWILGENIDIIKVLEIKLRHLPIYSYLTLAYRYFSMTKESKYLKEHEHKEQSPEDRTRINIIGKRYLFVYPFIKKREWYKMSESIRMSMMKEHFLIGHKYSDIKIHTTYCYGLHDYEFILIFESDRIDRFLELVEELRFSDASQYTLVDTPIFTCEKKTPEELGNELV